MEFKTERQKEVYNCWVKHGRVASRAALELGVDVRSVQRHVKELRENPGGTVPAMIDPGEGMFTKGTSTLVEIQEDGSVTPKLQWHKADKEKQNLFHAFETAVKRLSKEARPYTPAPRKLESYSKDTLSVIPIGDPHVGMQAWAQESGEPWDLKIAKSTHVDALRELLRFAPRSEVCILANLGDFFHMDDQTNQTPAHKHQLDVDNRWAKVLEVGLEIQVEMIELCLTHFKRVIVDNTRGNHDPHMSMMLSHYSKAYFRDESRVEVNMDPGLYHYHQFGRNMLAFHHGHRVKLEALPGVMAANRPQMWGETIYRKCYTGHVHSNNSIEKNGAKAESYGTLAARDAHAAGGGYWSERTLTVETWHEKFGLIGTNQLPVEYLAA